MGELVVGLGRRNSVEEAQEGHPNCDALVRAVNEGELPNGLAVVYNSW